MEVCQKSAISITNNESHLSSPFFQSQNKIFQMLFHKNWNFKYKNILKKIENIYLQDMNILLKQYFQ